MENMPDNNAFNNNINPNPQDPFVQAPQQGIPVYNNPQYNGQYVNPAQPPIYTNPPFNQGYPSNPHSYTPANTQQYSAYPYAPYNQEAAQSPSAVYNNTVPVNAPQYHYGNPIYPNIIDNNYYREQQLKLQKRRENEKKIRNISNITGIALIACFILATAFSGLVFIPGISDLYNSGLGGQALVNLFYSLTVVGGTFFVLGQILKRSTDKLTGKPKYKIDTKLNPPKDPIKALLIILISFGGCMLANVITSYLLAIFEKIGFSSGYSAMQNPKGVADIILMCIGTAIIPPLIEEYSMRGVLLSAQRKYGNVFAIVTSAYVFGMFHGNFAQIPFAFLCGLFFGYAVIATDSLWTAIIIHALNNALSCISSILITAFDEHVGNTFFIVCSITGIVLAILSLIIYVFRYKGEKVLSYTGDAQELPTKTKIAKFFSSPAVIVSTIIYILQAILISSTSSVPKV